MVNKGVTILIAVLLLSSLAVSALSFDVTKEKIKDTISVDGLAEFNITIFNKLKTKQEFKIRTLDYPIWDIYTKPVQNPITLEIPPNSTGSIKLFVDPLHVISVGTSDVNVLVKNEKIQEDKIIQLRVSIVSTESLIQGYVPTVVTNVEMPTEIDPREEFTIKVRLDNQNPLEYDELVIKLDSNVFNKEIKEKLGPKEKKELELTLQLNPNIEPQEDTLLVTVYSKDKIIVDPKVTKFKILSYSNIDKEMIPSSSFLKIRKDITFTNIGNDKYEGPAIIETTPLRSLFTLAKPKAIVETDDDKRNLIWHISLEPNESVTVTTSENYTVILVLVILIIIALLSYYLYRSPLTITKQASNIERREGGISDFKVVLTVQNRGNLPLKDIEVSDVIPKIADIERELNIGTLQPTRILKHENKGSMIKWIVDDLGVGEERVITYRIKSILPILGEFNLLSATAKFKLKDSKKKARSNSLTIS